jgi:hypothetical protein
MFPEKKTDPQRKILYTDYTSLWYSDQNVTKLDVPTRTRSAILQQGFMYRSANGNRFIGSQHHLHSAHSFLKRQGFETVREEVAWEWRKLHNEKFHNLFSLPNRPMIKSMGMGGVRSMHGEINSYKISVGTPDEKRRVGRHRLRWKHDTETDTTVQTGFIWLRAGTSCGLLWARQWRISLKAGNLTSN